MSIPLPRLLFPIALAAGALLVACADKPASSHNADAPAPQPATRSPRATTPTSSPAPAPESAADEPVSRGEITVQFGIMPGDYDDPDPGVLVGSVTPGTSADDAGIKEGDRLMTWNAKPIADIRQWMGYMMHAKPGDVVDVGVKRDGNIVPIKVTLKARQD
ncbi:MAG: PDZ domain-containing protein [Phycisphaerales bacterium]